MVTIHDVTFFTDPERYTASHAMSLKSATMTAARQATRLIVPSNATRDELVRVLGVDPARIDVAYHGVDHNLFHRPTPEQVTHVTARLGLRGKPYVAFLGSLTPRKNAPAVVRGLGRRRWPIWRTRPRSCWPAAAAGATSSTRRSRPCRPNLRLVRPGYLPFADLSGFLGGALVVAAPSRGEGFGLPVLEAMACGAPVLTTNRTSLPEVGGDAVAYTEPEAESIAAALRALLDDPERRMALGEAGHARAREFTWAASAAAHAASYKRAAESGPRVGSAGS